MRLSQESVSKIKWWYNIPTINYTILLTYWTTDTSTKGWGAVKDAKKTGCRWSDEVAKYHIQGCQLHSELTVALIFTPMTNLLTFRWSVLRTGKFTRNIKSLLNIRSRSRCCRLWSSMTALTSIVWSWWLHFWTSSILQKKWARYPCPDLLG